MYHGFFPGEERTRQEVEFNPDVLFFNCQGLKPHKVDCITSDYVSKCEGLKFLCFSEMWLDDESNIDFIHFPNFTNCVSFTRSRFIHGGVGIWHRRDMNVTPVDVSMFCVEKQVEFCCCLWRPDRHTSVYILNCYRPPTKKTDILSTFYANLDAVLEKIYRIGAVIVLGGDFNLDPIRDEKEYDKMYSILRTYDFGGSVVDQPTRGRYQLDHVFLKISRECEITCEVDRSPISDHCAVLLTVDIFASGFSGSSSQTSFKRRYTPDNIKLLVSLLENEPWDGVYGENGINESYQKFADTVKFYFDSVFPLRRVVAKNSEKLWCTDAVRQSSVRLKDLFILKSRYPIFSDHYKRARKSHLCLIRETKRTFYQRFIETSSNRSVAAWKVVNTLTNRRKAQSNLIIETDGVEESDPVAIADAFNNFFKREPVEILHRINARHFNGADGPVKPRWCDLPSVFLRPVSVDEVRSILRHKIKAGKTPGPDEIPPFILKALSDQLSAPLSYLINLSFQSGQFPEQLKTNCVLPLHKRGSVREISNYRPIAISSCFSKVFEYAYMGILMDYLNSHAILSENQHGFRGGRSTETALFQFYNRLVEFLDAGECPVGVFCDLSRAFDCVCHKKLLTSLESYGVRGIARSWIESFLSNRSQYVSLNHKVGGVLTTSRSQKVFIDVGVPQGSVLGPTLFLLYINEIDNALTDQHVTITMYADDTSFLVSSADAEAVRDYSRNVLIRAANWFGNSSLFLNEGKTGIVQFRPHQKQLSGFCFEGDAWSVESVNSVKFLGLRFDEGLTFRAHCADLVARLDSVCYMMRNLCSVLSVPHLLSVYYAHAESRLRYGIVFWGLSPAATEVFIRQKKILRIMAGVDDSTYSCRGLFKAFGVLSLSGLVILASSLNIHRKRGQLLSGSDLHIYETRQRNQLRCPFNRLNITQRAPNSMGIKIFNALPSNLRSETSLTTFKRKLKHFLVENCFYSLQEFYECCSKCS